MEDIQAAAACAAAQYAGRPFNIDNFNPQSDGESSDDSDGAQEINYNYDDPYNLRVNDQGQYGDNDDDNDDDEDSDEDSDDDPPLWGPR